MRNSRSARSYQFVGGGAIMMNRAMNERSRLIRLTSVGIALGRAGLNWVINALSRIARLTRDSIVGRLAKLDRPMKDLSHILRLTRVSVFVSILGAVAILVPDQFADALKSALEYSLLQLCVVALSALFAAASISLWARFMIARLAPQLLCAAGFSGWTARHLPMAAAVSLVIATAFALGQRYIVEWSRAFTSSFGISA